MLERLADGRTDLVFDHLATGGSATDACQGVTLLQWCAYYGDVSAIRYLHLNGAPLSLLGSNLDLNGAAYHGHWQLCQFLLENGADVNFALPDTGETALHAALCKAHRPAYDLVLQVLLAHGANPNVATKPGIETGSFMRDAQTQGETPLHRAAAFGTKESIEMLIAAGANIEARDAHGQSPLAWASWHARPGSILRLLCYGKHQISDAGVALYCVDNGIGWGGLEANLQGRPHSSPPLPAGS
jgi:uncharacterized protein